MNPLVFCANQHKMSTVAEQSADRSRQVRTQLSSYDPQLRRRKRRKLGRKCMQSACSASVDSRMLPVDEYVSSSFSSTSSCDSSVSSSSDSDSDLVYLNERDASSASECAGSDATQNSTRYRSSSGANCKRHRRCRIARTTSQSSLSESSSNEVGATYELYHRHNVHHTCLRQQRALSCSGHVFSEKLSRISRSLSQQKLASPSGGCICTHKEVHTHTSSI